MAEDLNKFITLRTEETENRYRLAKANNKSTDCRLCSIESALNFPRLNLWRIITNEYPYDKIAEASWMLVSGRHVSSWEALTEDERSEYYEFRKVAGGYGINIFMWSTSVTQSIPMHYHEHLLSLYRY